MRHKYKINSKLVLRFENKHFHVHLLRLNVKQNNMTYNN